MGSHLTKGKFCLLLIILISGCANQLEMESGERKVELFCCNFYFLTEL